MLSVVIATFDRAAILGRTLDRLDAQTAGPDAFEVVIGADANEPRLDAVRAVVGERPYPVRVVQAATPGVSAARNSAWPLARHPVVLFIGDDMLPAADLVARHLAHHASHPAPEDAMMGHVRWAREIRPTAFTRWLDHGIQFDFGSIPRSGARWYHFVAANASLKTALVERAGGFDEAFRFGYEELDLAYRLNEQGLRLHYDSAAEVEHLHPPTIEGWQRRMRTVARAERQFLAKYPEMKAYFHPMMQWAASEPPRSRLNARIALWVPRWIPRLGPRVRRDADLWFAQQVAPAFLEGWEDAGSG